MGVDPWPKMLIRQEVRPPCLYHGDAGQSGLSGEGVYHPIRLGALPLHDGSLQRLSLLEHILNLVVLEESYQTDAVGAEVEHVMPVIAEDERTLTLVVLEELGVDDVDLLVEDIVDALLLRVYIKRLFIHKHSYFHDHFHSSCCIHDPAFSHLTSGSQGVNPCAHRIYNRYGRFGY